MIKKLRNFTLLIVLNTLIVSCADKDPLTGKKILRETNMDKRIEKSEGFIFGKKKGNSVTLGGSSVMWKATLEVLDFLPIENASYAGGLISTSWYSAKNSNEAIKFNIKFYSEEISPNSIKIINFKRICSVDNKCSVSKGSENINQQIKTKIIEKSRELSIAQLQK